MPHFKSVGGTLIPMEKWLQQQEDVNKSKVVNKPKIDKIEKKVVNKLTKKSVKKNKK